MKMQHKEKCRAGKCSNGKCGTKLQGWKMWHKNAGRKNAGKENMAQEISGWKMQDKSVWKAIRCFLCNIKWIIIVYWQNKNNKVIHIFQTTV